MPEAARLASVLVAALVAAALCSCGQPQPTAKQTPAASPLASASASAAASARACGPEDLEPLSLTAISDQEWWVLVEPCNTFVNHFGGGPGMFAIEHTTDGGATFSSLPISGGIPLGVVPQMRFADEANGWVFGLLWATHDGGQHWSQVSVDVLQLEAGAGGWVYAVVCQHVDVQHCSIELRRARAGSNDWSHVLTIPGHSPTSAYVIGVHGLTLWVLHLSASGGGLWVSYDAGNTFVSRTMPCSPVNAGNDQIDPVSDTVIWAYCTDTSGGGHPLVSTDAGRTWQSADFSGTSSGIIAGISAESALVGDQGLARTANGGATFTRVPAWSSPTKWLGFTDSDVGYAIASAEPQIAGEPWRTSLWRTTDGGLRWTVVQFN